MVLLKLLVFFDLNGDLVLQVLIVLENKDFIIKYSIYFGDLRDCHFQFVKKFKAFLSLRVAIILSKIKHCCFHWFRLLDPSLLFDIYRALNLYVKFNIDY